MSRSVKHDVPGPDLRVAADDVRAKGWAASFGDDVASPLRLVVEIGFGRGEFLSHLALGAPDVAHVGIEISWKRVLKLARRLARGEQRNVRLITAPAEQALRDVIAPGSIDVFWLNFLDPWPKKRHQRRRLIQPPFVRLLADRLVPGGRIEVATDHVDYAEQIDRVLRDEPGLENALPGMPFARSMPGRLHTAYEDEWRAEGRPLHFWSARRPCSATPGDAERSPGERP